MEDQIKASKVLSSHTFIYVHRYLHPLNYQQQQLHDPQSTHLSIIINPILIRVYPRKWGWLDLPHSNFTPTLHLTQFMASSFSKPTLLFSFSTCVFHVFGRPHFFLPFTSNSNAFLKTCPSSLLNTCLYRLTPFTFAI